MILMISNKHILNLQNLTLDEGTHLIEELMFNNFRFTEKMSTKELANYINNRYESENELTYRDIIEFTDNSLLLVIKKLNKKLKNDKYFIELNKFYF